jgi:DNA-binding NarL/FixJ family response regulator
VDALALYVSEENDLQLVGTAAAALDGFDLLRALGCDVVVLADRLLATSPSGQGQGVVSTIRSLCPGLPVVLLADGAGAPADAGGDLLDVIADGVCGWVDRSAGLDALLAAVRDVSRGESHLPTDQVQALLLSRAARRNRELPSERSRVLTEREAAVLRGLAAGLSRAEISASLQLSPNTVRTHVRSILRKYHVHSAPDVVALMTEEDLRDD